jgi:SAM-dependent methyltransferase
MQKADALDDFLNRCATDDWARLQLTQPVASDGAQRLILRPLALRGEPHWQAVWRHPNKDLTENWSLAEAVPKLRRLLADDFRSAMLWTPQGQWQLDLHRKGHWRLVGHRQATLESAGPAHNREKVRLLDLAHPVWFDLGLSQPGRQGPVLVPAMASKWKQINRFVEIFDAAFTSAGLAKAPGPLRVADFGCGRAYLTFGVALRLAQQGIPAQVQGVELRADLVAQTEGFARQHHVDNLSFSQGNVGDFALQPLDVMVALHACDTATDHALHHGVRAGARVILCAPCCHKELRGQLQPPSVLRPLFRHGIHMGQEAEMLTDGLRSLLLESSGYDTKVFEFVSLEHTQKNKMILAVKRDHDEPKLRAEALEEFKALKEFWRIREQALERLLAG